MTPEKAKEILNLNLKEAGHKMPADCRDAVMFGVEAISRLLLQRTERACSPHKLLPGETET